MGDTGNAYVTYSRKNTDRTFGDPIGRGHDLGPHSGTRCTPVAVLKKYNLCRRKANPQEENMVVGDPGKTKGSHRVYKWSEKRHHYEFFKIIDEEDLKFTGSYIPAKNKDGESTLPILVEKAA